MIRNPAALGAIVCVLAAAIAWLADARDTRSFVQVFIISVVLLLALMGLGAVFGKTLGDFLRNVNG